MHVLLQNIHYKWSADRDLSILEKKIMWSLTWKITLLPSIYKLAISGVNVLCSISLSWDIVIQSISTWFAIFGQPYGSIQMLGLSPV